GGRRLAVVLGQRGRAIAAAGRLRLGPVVDLDRRQLALGRVEAEQAVAVDRVAAVFLVDPAVVEEDALAAWIVDELVPTLRAELALLGRIAAGLQRGVLQLHPGIGRQLRQVSRTANGNGSQKHEQTQTTHHVFLRSAAKLFVLGPCVDRANRLADDL